MNIDDVELIQRILAGDENAFETLIRKYQRQVHAHALRKIGDFQIAEDITQETFLRVYQKLETLNNPTQFSTWLYAIVNNLCIAWFRKKRLQAKALQEVHISETETEAYSQYVATEHAKVTADAQRDLVKKLLTKLKRSDREVITLHYFEEMSSSEIGDLLGVPENTIKSRLYRARQRLKTYEFMIHKTLDITTEAEYYSQSQLEGETTMSAEVRDETKTGANQEETQQSLTEIRDMLLETQRELATVQKQLKIITDESDSTLSSAKREALSALLQLPYDAKDPISWGYGGAYRAASGHMSKRGSIWTTSVDEFLSAAPDAEIVRLATFFTNPTVVAVLRQLVDGKKSVEDLANGCGISEGEMEETIAMLIDAALVKRTEDSFIEPKNDAIFYFLNFVGMVKVFLNPENHHSKD